MSNYYNKSVADVESALGTSISQGLTKAEATARLEKYGPNELSDQENRGILQILWEQFSSPLVVLLVVAGGVSFFLEEYKDATVIGIIIVLNGALGFFQDFRAEKALASLKKLAVPLVTVLRGEKLESIPAGELVPGDVVLVETGKVVPADSRIVEAHNLYSQEATLTGESIPIEKSTDAINGKMPLADQVNQIFSGTQIVKGRGKAIVVGTGAQSELGKIAGMLGKVHRPPTPLQTRLARLGKGLALAALVIVALVFALGVMQGEDLKLMLMTALGMAVAAVPEGLPAVATVTLAMGAGRMFNKQALIRKLPAVETLGSVTVICSDKTGTLTQNKMSVTNLWTPDGEMSLDSPEDFKALKNQDTSGFNLMLFGGALCNDAKFQKSGHPHQTIGEPTEESLIVAAYHGGMAKEDLDRDHPREKEIPFSSERKRMTTSHGWQGDSPNFLKPILTNDQKGISFTKGAVDYLLPLANRVLVGGEVVDFTEEWRRKCTQQQDALAKNGRRVLALCGRYDGSHNGEPQEKDLVFVGLFGLIDPPRPEVKQAVAECLRAGIRPIMITGDHPLTARAIADELDIPNTGQVITGMELDDMSEAQFEEQLAQSSIFARVSPEHKLKIVNCLQDNNEVVAMTGDGVNDAPALKKADIGVGMGITGTDVSKEAAEMILLNDNFASIVDAVREGRIVYDNIRKFVKYTLTSNTGEILVMLAAPFLGMPLPLLPLQILWVNLVTDGLPGLALAVEPPEKKVMQRPPYSISESFFSRGLVRDIVWVGGVMGAVSLFAGYLRWDPDTQDLSYFRTMVFTVLTFSQLGNALSTRSDSETLWRLKLGSNKFMLFSVVLTFVLQLGIIYTPFGRSLLDTAQLSLTDFFLCLLLSTSVFVLNEGRKALTT